MRILTRRPNFEHSDMTRSCNLHQVRPLFARMLLSSGPSSASLASQSTPAQLASLQPCLRLFQDPKVTLVRTTVSPWEGTANLPRLFGAPEEGAVHAILCVARENVSGGLHKLVDATHGHEWHRELHPGELLVFKPTAVEHLVTSELVLHPDPRLEGYLDYVLISSP
jgi:hypothetical protein